MPTSVIPVTGALQQPVGAISQTDFPIVHARLVNGSDTKNVNFGDPVVLNLGAPGTYSSVAQFIAGGGTLAGTTPLAIAKETVEPNSYFPNEGGTGMPAGFYAPGMACNGLTKGTINVAINHGTPAGANSPVYIRILANAGIPNGVVGGFEAVADGSNTVEITNIVFTTGELSTDPVSGQVTAQVTILNRTVA